jgi:hypothetical protein
VVGKSECFEETQNTTKWGLGTKPVEEHMLGKALDSTTAEEVSEKKWLA